MVSAPAPGAARSQPSPAGTDLENVLREDRQQRDGAAEEHGEQVERDRGEEQRVVADEAEPGEHVVRGVVPRCRWPALGARAASATGIMNTTWPIAAAANGSVAVPALRDQHAAHRRTADRRELEDRRQPRVGVGELGRSEQLRQDAC